MTDEKKEEKLRLVDIGGGYYFVVPAENLKHALLEFKPPKEKTSEALKKSYIDLVEKLGITVYRITKTPKGEKWEIVKDPNKLAKAGEEAYKIAKVETEKKIMRVPSFPKI